MRRRRRPNGITRVRLSRWIIAHGGCFDRGFGRSDRRERRDRGVKHRDDLRVSGWHRRRQSATSHRDMLRPARAWLAALVFSASACITGSNTLDVPTTLTMITADPAAFVGSSACGTRLRRYVVTLADVTEASARQLLSSPPTPCTQLVSFTEILTGVPSDPGIPIVVGELYVGAIDGYDSDDLTPDFAGSPSMHDSTGAHVAPRWSTTCGQWPSSLLDASQTTGDSAIPPSLLAPVQAKQSTEVFLLGCVPFADPISPGSESSEPDAGPGVTNDASQDDAENGSISSD
jgi:hypothetical protein